MQRKTKSTAKSTTENMKNSTTNSTTESTTKRGIQPSDKYPGQSRFVSLTLALGVMWCVVAFATHYLATHGLNPAALIVKYTMLTITIPIVGYALVRRKQLAFQEEYLRVVLSSMQEGILVCDNAENIQYANPSAQKVFPGFETINDLFLSTTFYNGDSDIPVPLNGRPVSRALRGEAVSDQIVHIHREGKEMALLVTATPVRDAYGRIQGVVEVSHDITALRTMERQQKRQEQVFRMVAEHISDIVVAVDTSGMVVYVSPSVKVILGINPEDLIGQSAFLRVHNEDLASIQGEHAQILATKKGLSSEFRYLHSQGHYVLLETNVEPVLDEKSDVCNIVILARDVTDKKREQELLKGQNRVLSLIANDAPIVEIFMEITQQVEALNKNVICAITMLNGNEVLHVAPTLPQEISNAIDSMQVAELPQQYLYEEVFVGDVSNDPNYRRLHQWVQQHQFTATWSKPIQTPGGKPVGICAVVYKGPFESKQAGIELYNAYAQMAALAIEQKQSKREIAESEQRYKSLFDNNLDAVYQFDLDGRFVGANKALAGMFGYSYAELLDMHFLQLVAPKDVEPSASVFEEVKRGKVIPLELSAYHKNGERLILHTINLPIRIDGRITGTFGIAKDITSHRYSQELLANQKRVLEMIAKGSSLEEVLDELTRVAEYHSQTSMCNLYLLQDDNRTLHYVTGHQKLKGYHDDLGIVTIGPGVGACGTAPFLNSTVIVEDIETHPLYENYRHISLKHGLRACFATPIVSTSGKVLGAIGLYYNKVRRPIKEELELMDMISHLAGLAMEHRKADEEIEYLAHYDPLTGLPNRTLFFNRLTAALMEAQEGKHQLAVMFLDLDQFKSINDSMGHHFGDRTLRNVAERMKNCLESDHLLSRMGGDEFTILLPRIDSMESVISLVERIISSCDAPVELGGYDFRLTTSIGIAVFPESGDSTEALMRNADAAMYVAKNNGKNMFRFYDQSMSEQPYERMIMENALRRGLENGEFVLHYQPRVKVESQSVASVEALLRWKRPDVGIVLPGEFIPVAEDIGLIVPIGKWVLYEACRQIKAWESSGRGPVRIAVNVSPRQFQEPDFMDIVERALRETGVSPRWLEIEVTESGLMENEHEVLSTLHELKTLGIKISIDDFGVGYSSLNRLKRMPVDALKIDRSFIRDMLLDDAAMTKAIISLAHNLHLNVVAEGVEVEEQFNLLQQLGCDEIQGYYFTPPISVDEFERRYMDKSIMPR